MKAKDKPRYVKEARKLHSSINIEKLISNPNDLGEISKINRLTAIFTNFSSNDGADLKNLFVEFQKWGRAGERPSHIRNCAVDMLQFINQKIEDMDTYVIEPDKEAAQTGPVGILNKGKNNTFVENVFGNKLQVGIQNEGTGTIAVGNKFLQNNGRDKLKERWYQKWWIKFLIFPLIVSAIIAIAGRLW